MKNNNIIIIIIKAYPEIYTLGIDVRFSGMTT